MQTTAGLVVLGTMLTRASTAAAQWSGDDGAARITATLRPGAGARTWLVELELLSVPGRVIARGEGETREAAEGAMHGELVQLVAQASGSRRVA